MVSTFSILSEVFKVVKTNIAGSINGGVYIGEEPEQDQKENVTMNVLTNPIGYTQEGVMNVNIHVMGLKGSRPNLKRMNELVQIILPVFDNTDIQSGSTCIHFEIAEDKGFFKDSDNNGKYFYNIRINFLTL